MTLWKNLWVDTLFRLSNFFLLNHQEQEECGPLLQLHWHQYMEDIDENTIIKIWHEEMGKDGTPAFREMCTIGEVTEVFVTNDFERMSFLSALEANY